MLYFAYGSNLHHFQMKRRCKDSIFLKKINLKDFKLTFRSKYRAADIEAKKNSIVPGALFEISKNDEKKLDVYEDFPILYKKHYFYYYGKKVMTYTMVKKSPFKFPTERYLNVVKKGYRDCKLDKRFLLKALSVTKSSGRDVPNPMINIPVINAGILSLFERATDPITNLSPPTAKSKIPTGKSKAWKNISLFNNQKINSLLIKNVKNY